MSVEKVGEVRSFAAKALTVFRKGSFGKRIAVSPQTYSPCTVLGEPSDGIIRTNLDGTAIAGALDNVAVMMDGVSLMRLGVGGITTVNGKAAVTTDATGNAIAAGAGNSINGWAYEDGVEGQEIPIEFNESLTKAVV